MQDLNRERTLVAYVYHLNNLSVHLRQSIGTKACLQGHMDRRSDPKTTKAGRFGRYVHLDKYCRVRGGQIEQ